MQNKNIFILDIIRALCILWIVVVWHGNDYLPMEYHWSSVVVPGIVTKVVLFLFTLLSGMLLSKYNFWAKEDVWNFYKRRFGRFYILFFIAVLLFYLCGFYTLKTSIKCISGISMFIGQAPFTLWYISMLMVFYILTPILQYRFNMSWLRIFSPILVFAGIVLLRVFNVTTDNNLILYFISYELGLLIGEKVTTWLRDHDWKVPVSIRFLIEKVAYASFCMYLYHRVIYYAIGKITCYADGGIIFCMPIWCNVAALVSVLILSYYMQLYYDKFFKNINIKSQLK